MNKTKKMNILLMVLATIVVVTSLIAHVESEHKYFGDNAGTIFWLTAIIGTSTTIMIWFGLTKMLEDKKDVLYKVR
jgi:hypothetical protein